MAGYTGFSCEEEYDHYMQAEAEAESQYAEAVAEAEEIISAMKFLASKDVEPNHYKSFYEQNKKFVKIDNASYIDETDQQRQERLKCTLVNGVRNWRCKIDCAFWNGQSCDNY